MVKKKICYVHLYELETECIYNLVLYEIKVSPSNPYFIMLRYNCLLFFF